ncbi:uncharacterized protein LOC128233014 isoform X2 [Mya arenaria]|uniref:uncharacterized protein LOC128233014 isoform X2 n=1 Tax=Mya arenaria TaxID=6604 RepID=UPI0022E0DFC1|nr:uncharacterized protein LOC128233014 isoform X2 [Mya arenaria]
METLKVIVIVFLMANYAVDCQMSTDVLWESCDTQVCGSNRLNIQCDPTSYILINNVTSGVSKQYDLLSYSNLRRSCLGLSICKTSDPNVFCRNHERPSKLGTTVSFNVSYVCVKMENVYKSCDPAASIENKVGFIFSPNYPTETRYRTCRWKITVPEGHFVHIYLHEVLPKTMNPEQCTDGLHFSSKNTCGQPFPTYPICYTQGFEQMIVSCSTVEILLLPSTDSDTGIRFWLSYHVVTSPDLRRVSMFKTDITCNVSPLDTFIYRASEIENKTVVEENTTSKVLPPVTPAEVKTSGQTDYVVYIGLAVGIFILIAIIVLAILLLRFRCSHLLIRDDSKKETGSISMSNSLTNCSEIQKRPLPERQSTCSKANALQPFSEPDTVVGGGLALQQAYSVVADELPRTQTPPVNPVYSTYAEIEECTDTADKPNPPLTSKRSVDNSKRELPAKPKDDNPSSIYFEIYDVEAKDAKTEKDSVEYQNKRNQESAEVPKYGYKKKLSNASNIYAECEEVPGKDAKREKPYMDMSHKRLNDSGYESHAKDTKEISTPHSKLSKDKVNLSKKSKVSDNSSIRKNPFVESDAKRKLADKGKGHSKHSVTSESDSEDEIVVENELYEPFESAKV